MFELKPMSPGGIPAALAKVERYRLLNEPREAESICLDVLDVEPDNQQALVMLLLARTDQFQHGPPDIVVRAQGVLRRLHGEYERAYYGGIICERRAKAIMMAGAPGFGGMAYEWLREAMGWFEKAEALRAPGNDDAVLRWNTCARLLNDNPQLQPRAEEDFSPVFGE